MANKRAPAKSDERVGLNLSIPVEIHRRAKAAAALRGFTWDGAVADALDAWARAQLAQEGGRR